jgi:mannose-6-phosphate isomerase
VVRLPIRVLEKPWGTPRTEPWYSGREKDGHRGNIGEVWFRASKKTSPLVKFLFTSARLSVQVHPPGPSGKTEMWHVLRAVPGAYVWIGLKQNMTRNAVKKACLSGEISELLNRVEVIAGETYFIPAGTIHAIGPGIVTCEVQQNSDITYRLFDYGSDRELHLECGLDVAILSATKPHAASLPLRCDYFVTERLNVAGSVVANPRAPDTLLIALEGEGSIAGESFRAGDGFEAAGGSAPFTIESERAVFLITSESGA